MPWLVLLLLLKNVFSNFWNKLLLIVLENLLKQILIFKSLKMVMDFQCQNSVNFILWNRNIAREYKEFLRVPIIYLLEIVWSILFFEYNWYIEIKLNKLNTKTAGYCIEVDFTIGSAATSNSCCSLIFLNMNSDIEIWHSH